MSKPNRQISIKVTIEGRSPILLNSPEGMTAQSDGKKKIPPPDVEAAGKCYWLDETKSTLVFPGLNIQRSMVSAATAFKAGRISMTPYIAGSIEVQPELVPFLVADAKGKWGPVSNYSIDIRRAVVQRQGIMRARPKIKEWRLTFTILVSIDDMPQRTGPEMIKAILAEAGRRVGIGDFRPQKTGPFGKFVIIEWVESDVPVPMAA